ncbi:unnamed protein product [Cylicocyclus nassatus]|uniref:Uncharacterized protein n=1 Tax=Cylicocyclus nassatus TaxID=53992 RepID=A0AA36M5E2_CYLNA|nr:unnamed protein product [Cylicocyclus nassatus]
MRITYFCLFLVLVISVCTSVSAQRQRYRWSSPESRNSRDSSPEYGYFRRRQNGGTGPLEEAWVPESPWGYGIGFPYPDTERGSRTLYRRAFRAYNFGK